MNDAPKLEGPLQLVSLARLQASVGQLLGISQWFTVEQQRIQRFADTTHDHYALHVDPARASQGPFGACIAHGFLCLSLLAPMAYQACPAVAGARATLNYGFERVRFVHPVRSGERVRGHFVLALLQAEAAAATLAFDVRMEIEGQSRPALVAQWLQRVLL